MTSCSCVTMWITLAIAVVLCAPVNARAQAPTFQIVFQSDRAKNSDLWLVDSNGNNERPLTRTTTPDASPSWSPDGSMIVYACAPSANWELCTIDPTTRRVTQLTKTAADEFDPRYTSSGRQIVHETYARDSRNADIAIMPASGGVPKRLTATPNADDQDPAPDPNSSRIAFASNGNIAILDTDAPGRVERVTRGSRGDTDPSFSSRDEIAFARPSGRARGRSRDIVVTGPAGQRQRIKQITPRGSEDIEPAWTADGTQILFARASTEHTRRFRIFRVSTHEGDQRAVTKGGAYSDTEPAPQPRSGARLLRGALRLTVHAVACNSISGTNGNNTLRGTTRSDCVSAKDGNDRIYVTGGRQDHVSGGAGADEAWIDDGYDTCTSAVRH